MLNYIWRIATKAIALQAGIEHRNERRNDRLSRSPARQVEEGTERSDNM